MKTCNCHGKTIVGGIHTFDCPVAQATITEVTRWGVLIEGDITRLAGGGDVASGMTYIFLSRRGASQYCSKIGMGKPVKVTVRVEK